MHSSITRRTRTCALAAAAVALAAAGTMGPATADPPTTPGGPWPQGLPLQIHLMEADEFALEGDLDAARELEETVESAELFLYPGDRHLFADESLADYDEGAATLLKERTISFLADVG